MADFNRDRKPGGFGGRGGSSDRGGFGGRRASSDRGGFGGRSGGSDRGGRSFGARSSFDRPTMYKAVCSECGNNCEVPFQPTGSKPVLCSPCFSEQQGGGGGRDFGTRDFGARDFSRDKSFEKKMFNATCEGCGEKCEVPFKPTPGKSVFCDNCFRGNDVPAKPKTGGCDGKHQEQLSAINAKLDEILRTLKGASKPEKAEKSIEKIETIKEIADVVINKKANEKFEEVIITGDEKVKKPAKVKSEKEVKEVKVKKTAKKK